MANDEDDARRYLFGAIPIVVRDDAPPGVITLLALTLHPSTHAKGDPWFETGATVRYAIGVDHGAASGSVDVVMRVWPDGRVEAVRETARRGDGRE